MNDTGAADAVHARQEHLGVPWNLTIPEADIYLVGYGNRLPNDLTLELLAVLQRCKRIFGLPPLHAPAFKVPPMESLMHLYGRDKLRGETYREMLETVLAAAQADPPVALATYGSAMVGTYVMHRILEAAEPVGLRAHVTNAPSSFDGIWADFNIDPCRGFKVWEASTFLHLRIVPNTRAHLLLPQAPVLDVTVGIDPETMKIATSTTVPALRDRLLEFYPPEHEVHFVTTDSGAAAHISAPVIETVALRDLDHPGRHPASTLLVPRLQRAELDFERPRPLAVAPE